MDRHSREFVRALHRVTERSARYHASPPTRYAVVHTIDPITAELVDRRELLDDEDLVLGQTVLTYDEAVGIEVGDTLCVIEMSNGDFTAIEVLSDNAPPTGGGGGGGAPSGPAGGVLGGTYPNPGFAVDMATQTELNAVSAAKANTSHTHAESDITGLVSDLAAKQPLDADLTALAALTSAADKLAYATGSGTWSLTDLSAYARTLLDDANAAAARTTLGAQAQDTDLDAIAALTSAADKVPYSTGAGTWAMADLTSQARALLDDTTQAAMQTTLDVYSKAVVDLGFGTKRANVNPVTTQFELPILENAATQTTSPYANNISGWTLADAATPVLSAQGVFPGDVTTGNFIIRLLIAAPTVAASPNDVVRLGCSYRTIGDGGTISTALTGVTTQNVALTANTLKYVDFAPAVQPTAGNFIAVRMFRDGTHANDTLAASAYLHGIVIVYTATV